MTSLFEQIRAGAPGADAALFDLLHAELRRIAGRFMARQADGHTLQPTALVNEAYLRLVDRDASWADRAHFLNAAARAMRWILVDHARARGADKRKGVRVTLDEERHGTADGVTEVVVVHEALEKLEEVHPEHARVVELRYFAGLEYAEIAQVLGVTERTIYNRWKRAKAWLFRQIGEYGAT